MYVLVSGAMQSDMRYRKAAGAYSTTIAAEAVIVMLKAHDISYTGRVSLQ